MQSDPQGERSPAAARAYALFPLAKPEWYSAREITSLKSGHNAKMVGYSRSLRLTIQKNVNENRRSCPLLERDTNDLRRAKRSDHHATNFAYSAGLPRRHLGAE